MHDVNPLGLTMYLRELDRQATEPRRLRPANDARGALGFFPVLAILLQRARRIAERHAAGTVR